MARTSLDHTARLLSEGLARAVNRRTFLKRAGQATFGVVATLAAGHSLAERADAQIKHPNVDPLNPLCGPPGPYCNTGGGDLSGCHGAHCFQHLYNGQVIQCHIWEAFYPAGCWTTAAGNGAYWTCCDCLCDGGPSCGCAQLSTGPVPLPDSVSRTRD